MDNKNDLIKKNCIPCKGGIPPLKGNELLNYYNQLKEGWKLIDEHFLEKTYIFDTFKEGLLFTMKVGDLAESEGHHPEIILSFKKVTLKIWTHKIEGLTESDFILAAKCDEIKK